MLVVRTVDYEKYTLKKFLITECLTYLFINSGFKTINIIGQ